MQRRAMRMFEMVNELVACSQMANENSYGWIHHQEKPGRMISMGSIGHSICSNYRKPMKILFYLRVSRIRTSTSRVTEFLPVTPTSSLFGESLHYCQSHCNVIAVVNRSLSPLFLFFILFSKAVICCLTRPLDFVEWEIFVSNAHNGINQRTRTDC